MRLPYDAVMEMSEGDAEEYLDAWLEINGGKKTKTYLVKRSRKE